MPLSSTTLLVEIADSLSDYGSFDPTGTFLSRRLESAAARVHKDFAWPFMLKQSTIATTQGNLGPYDVPADFGGLVPFKGVNKFFAVDQYAVPPAISDGPQGQRYPIVYDEAAEKIRFFYDPGTGTRTFTYLQKYSILTDIDTWPDETWLKDLLTHYTMYFALVLTPDFKEESDRYMVLATELKKEQMRSLRQRGTRPDSRMVLDNSGNPMYYHLSGVQG
jgi:hypothetical protein